MDFKTLSSKKYILLDGAMGTMLQKRGLQLGGIPEELNMTSPEMIEEVHKLYVQAGSDIIYTNTFGANRYKLSHSQYSVEEIITAGNIEVDKAAHVVKVCGNPVELSFKEFELLVYFIENKGIALSREKILNNVWNYDYFGDARTIDTHVKKLRSKLGDKGEYIKTIWGMGYKFEV